MPDYSKSVVYKICCKDADIKEFYVGSSCNLYNRKRRHKTGCTYVFGTEYNLLVYKFMRDNGGWDNWEFEILENYEAKDEKDLIKRERHWFDNLKPTLNTNIPARTKDEHKLYKKNYQLEHKEQTKERDKAYRQEHKEEIAEKNRVRYEENKEKISEQRKEKVTCECGSILTKTHLPRHKKSTKHIELMKKINK